MTVQEIAGERSVYGTYRLCETSVDDHRPEGERKVNKAAVGEQAQARWCSRATVTG
jgi:hypothetical protein